VDGVHDLGGVEGFGPIKTTDDERPFKFEWEGRMWGLNEAMVGDPGWTLDWWRHVRELIAPVDYLTRPYFDQWAQVYAALLIDSGHASLEEVANGTLHRPASGLGRPMDAKEVRAASSRTANYTRDTDATPAFAIGDRVMTRSMIHTGHTRLPRYARDRPGIIHACRGTHVLPDASARGREHAEPLYTVSFQAGDLWPEAAGRRDRVFLDLWESYLER
jgi:nitrile hydratase beta subunit